MVNVTQGCWYASTPVFISAVEPLYDTVDSESESQVPLVFSHWEGYNATLRYIDKESTFVLMPPENVQLTAIFVPFTST